MFVDWGRMKHMEMGKLRTFENWANEIIYFHRKNFWGFFFLLFEVAQISNQSSIRMGVVIC